MTRALIGHTPLIVQFVAHLLDFPEDFGPCEGLGFLDRDGFLEAGIIYHNFQRKYGIIEITAAARGHKWGTRGRLKAIFAYPFDQLGCQMVVARTSERNPTPLRIWRALGADEYRIPRLRGRDEAEIVTTLTVEQWRKSYGRKLEART